MGANAQTAVPAFVAGEILTAAEMTQVNTGIPVFATTVTRDAAFDGTGEKVLAEGQFAYIEATDTTQYYNGSSWVSVGTSGFTLITAQSFSSVTAVNINSCFTSTYQNYRVVFNSGDPATNQTFTMRLRAGGTDDANNLYFRQSFGVNAGGTFSVVGQATSWFIANAGSTSTASADFTVFSPNEAARTKFAGTGTSNSATFLGVTGYLLSGWFDNTTVFDGFSIIFGASTTGTVRVYGLSNS
jgi:hypothetical protein